MIARVLLTTLLLTAAGCTSTRTDKFDIAVHNNTPQDLTLSLAKTGGPYEPTWQTPEEFAIESPKIREQMPASGTTRDPVPPGKSAAVQGLVGQFYSDSHPVLRIYAGKPTIAQMLARPPGSPDRLDIPLMPGSNDFTIEQQGTSLKVNPVGGR